MSYYTTSMAGTIQVFALSWVIGFLFHPIVWDCSFVCEDLSPKG